MSGALLERRKIGAELARLFAARARAKRARDGKTAVLRPDPAR